MKPEDASLTSVDVCKSVGCKLFDRFCLIAGTLSESGTDGGSGVLAGLKEIGYNVINSNCYKTQVYSLNS